MNQIKMDLAGQQFTFSVELEHDNDHGEPWKEECGHGPVTEWERREKLPGELVLISGRGCAKFYDFAEACRIALREGWDAKPYNDGSQTKRQQAAKAARADFENLRAWCNDEWSYMGVIVTLLDEEGEKTEVSQSLWGVDNQGDYCEEVARELAGELLAGFGTSWGSVTKATFGYIQQAVA